MNHESIQWVETLADRYGRMVLAAAWRVLGDADEAQDVMQEVFMKLLGAGAGPSTARNWGGFLKVTATRCAIDHLRRRRRRLWQTARSAEHLPTPEGCSPALLAEQHQQMDRIRAIVAGFSPRDAAIFTLRYFEEFSYEEIAAQTGLPVGQIGVILHRTRRRLLKSLRLAAAPAAQKEHDHANTSA